MNPSGEPKHRRHPNQEVAENQHQDKVIGGGVKASQRTKACNHLAQLMTFGWFLKRKSVRLCWWVPKHAWTCCLDGLCRCHFLHTANYTSWYCIMVPLTVAKPSLHGGTCLRSWEPLSVMRGPNLLYETCGTVKLQGIDMHWWLMVSPNING